MAFPPSNALNYKALQDQVLGRRFPASTQRANVKIALAQAYAELWALEDWTFKVVSDTAFVTTDTGLAGGVPSATPLMPGDFQEIVLLYDDQGSPVEHLTDQDFARMFRPVTTGSGRPEAFAVVNSQIRLGPTPDAAYQFTIDYRRRLAHKDLNGTVAAGYFTVDTDYPLWDDHHLILAQWARQIMLEEFGDWTGQISAPGLQRALASFRADYLADPVGLQWGG